MPFTNNAAPGRSGADGQTRPANPASRASAVAALLIGETAGVSEQQSPVRHLTQVDVARRWRMSERTLERWRWLGQGPAYLKVGASVVYKVEDIESHEAACRRVPGKNPDPFFRSGR